MIEAIRRLFKEGFGTDKPQKKPQKTGNFSICVRHFLKIDAPLHLYSRRNLLFVLGTETLITQLEELEGLPVARDKDAFSETLLTKKGLKTEVRLVKTDSKEEAFNLLATGRVMAAFMPEAVGWTLARQAGIAVRTIDLGDPGSPVGFAFRRGQTVLAAQMDEVVERLEKRGVLTAILDKYRARGLQ